MTNIRIIDRIDRMAKSVKTPRPRSHGPILSHFGVPQASSPRVIGTVNDRNRKMTVHETTMVYADVPAIETSEVPQTNSTDRAAPVHIAATGVRYFGLTAASIFEPGRPP